MLWRALQQQLAPFDKYAALAANCSASGSLGKGWKAVTSCRDDPAVFECFRRIFRPVRLVYLPSVSLSTLEQQAGVTNNATMLGVLPMYWALRHAFALVATTDHQVIMHCRTDIYVARMPPFALPGATTAGMYSMAAGLPRTVWIDPDVWDSAPERRAAYGSRCGRMPSDKLAFGSRSAMAAYASAFEHLAHVAQHMHGSEHHGYRDWMELDRVMRRAGAKLLLERATDPHDNSTHLYARVSDARLHDEWLAGSATFFNNPEGWLGHHLRLQELRCHPVDLGATVVRTSFEHAVLRQRTPAQAIAVAAQQCMDAALDERPVSRAHALVWG